MTGPQMRGVRFLQENAMALAVMAVAGFSIMYVADPGDLDDKTMRDGFLETIRQLRSDVPRERAFLVLSALNEVHPDPAVRDELRKLTEQMRRRP